MPYDPNHCTHHDDPMRQQVFACLTCRTKNKQQDNGICYSCSIRCHSNHELVELFTRRGFSCDCGTTRMASFGACNLRKNFDSLDSPEDTNSYSHNFSGKFCSCDDLYDASKEQGTMFQCLLGDVCKEDWFHEECILGIERGGSRVREVGQEKGKEAIKEEISDSVRSKYPPGVNVYDSLEPAESPSVKAPEEIKEEERQQEDSVDKDGDNEEVEAEVKAEDEAEDEDDDTLEGLPSQGEIGAFICWKCVKKHPILSQWGSSWPDVAHKPVIHGSFKTIEERELFIKGQSEIESGGKEQSNNSVGVEYVLSDKRKLSDNDTTSSLAKRIKSNAGELEVSVFLKPGYYNHIRASNDQEVVSFTDEFPFLLEEEDVYEPPQDDDANSSLLDAGTRALNSLPRDQAIDGMHAYSMIRERLSMFLRPFAEQGKVVTKNDVTNFFNEVRNKK